MRLQALLLGLIPLFLVGCGQSNVPPKIQVPSAASVQSITIQGATSTSSHVASNDVKGVISDLRQAKEIQYEKEIKLGAQPIASADLHLKNGEDLTIQTAIDCQIQTNGNQGETVCKNLPGYVDVISGNNLPIRLQSQTLYQWLVHQATTGGSHQN